MAPTFAYPVLASPVARARRLDRFYRNDYNPYALRPDEIIGDAGPWSGDRAPGEWLRGRALRLPFDHDDCGR